MAKTIGNPLSWLSSATGRAAGGIDDGVGELSGTDTDPIVINELSISDIHLSIRAGFEDFLAMRTDVMFIVLIYPIIGILLTWTVVNTAMLPLLFPLMSGFALLGPVAAIVLYEMSRRREQGENPSWGDGFSIINSPSFVPILLLAIYLFVIFLFWLFIAYFLYTVTLGPEAPTSSLAFVRDVFTTGAGWTMLITGMLIGFVFATLAFVISLVSFPLLIDRHVGLAKAIVTSLNVARKNPTTVAVWAAIIALSLGLGAITLFAGLIVVLPVMGHASWHFYRRAVAKRE